MRTRRKIFDTFPVFFILVFFHMNCKQPYNPPAIKGNNQYLVVDGFIRNGPDSTIFKLSRSANLGDSAAPQPELNAQVVISGQSSGNYSLFNIGNGEYAIDGLNLDVTQNYKLKIRATNGNQYESDYVPVRQSPPIDSLHWQLDSVGVTIYANTHDPQNNTRYYQWDFTQTWEHRVHYNSSIYLLPDGTPVNRTPDQEINRCWTSTNSTDILVASTSGLSQDVVSENPILSIANGSEQISFVYSMLIRQYAITEGAYEYWQNLKKNTELTGTIFDAQPSEVQGNIHGLTNPSEPVLGYVSASSVSTLRIFINRNQIPTWYYYAYNDCFWAAPDPDSLAYYASIPSLFVPFIECIGPACFVAITDPECGDCRFWGGTNSIPPYWPF